ncbi:hypothetical protein [Oceanobacillus jeddahense]|uniref:hypothetical protein n=1 Tax=Oceanobacillus jeddahense TaxID=1462527 RepID=UPI000595A0FF|nr:hypothetical protein [Oceanobacillus jeddahense]
MDKSLIGSLLLLISAIFYATRYISGSILMINSGEWSQEEYSLYLTYIPSGLMIFTVISLILGIVLIVWEYIKPQK